MSAPLMGAVARGLAARQVGVLRFDFRGVGNSGGSHEGGVGEFEDVLAAVALAAHVAPEVGLAGWSFGAGVALRTLPELDSDIPYVGVAPPLTDPPDPEALRDRRMVFVVGTRDQVVDAEAIERYAAAAHATAVLIDGADHLFTLRSERVVEAIATVWGRSVDD